MKHETVLTLVISLLLCSSCIQPPLHLPGQELLTEMPAVETELSVVWNVDVDWSTDWYYGWDSQDTEIWGDIGYTLMELHEDRAVARLTQYEFFFLTPAGPDEQPLPQWSTMTEDHQGATCTFNYLR